MSITVSKLRENIYRFLDKTIESGQPLKIERRGHIVKILPDTLSSKFSRLIRRKCIKGAPEDIVHVDWSKEWKP